VTVRVVDSAPRAASQKGRGSRPFVLEGPLPFAGRCLPLGARTNNVTAARAPGVMQRLPNNRRERPAYGRRGRPWLQNSRAGAVPSKRIPPEIGS